MLNLKPLVATKQSKRSAKDTRLYKVLTGLVEYYIASSKPVGSNTLKETGFPELSSATIRNYFAQLEEEGYLRQLHTSGGRVPTDKAYKLYAAEALADTSGAFDPHMADFPLNDSREISKYLQAAAEWLSRTTNTAIFLSSPRFDNDFVADLKLVALDNHRLLCIVVTDFGLIQTVTLHTDYKLTAFLLKRLESYFQWRIKGMEKPETLTLEEETLAQTFYNEVMVRYIVNYSYFTQEDIYRTGFSQLLHYTEFHDATTLASSLTLFENHHRMRLLLRECSSHGSLRYWIGDELATPGESSLHAAVIAVPYLIGQKTVGAIGLMGPTRMPYGKLFQTLHHFSAKVGEALTQTVYKFKLTFRQPEHDALYPPQKEQLLLESKLKSGEPNDRRD